MALLLCRVDDAPDEDELHDPPSDALVVLMCRFEKDFVEHFRRERLDFEEREREDVGHLPELVRQDKVLAPTPTF